MINPKVSWILFISAGITLILGFNSNVFWIIGGLLGLIPAITWVINDLRSKTFGSDILAVLALIGALLTGELFAASVISFMLASGRILESWAQARAEKQLKALIERVPRFSNRVLSTGMIEEIELNEIAVGDRLLVRSGEIVPTNGQLTQAATLDESALTGEPFPVNRAESEMINSGIVNAGARDSFIRSESEPIVSDAFLEVTGVKRKIEVIVDSSVSPNSVAAKTTRVDEDPDDETQLSGTELLMKELGAQVIAESEK